VRGERRFAEAPLRFADRHELRVRTPVLKDLLCGLFAMTPLDLARHFEDLPREHDGPLAQVERLVVGVSQDPQKVGGFERGADPAPPASM
jgi:hypothetical protein